MRVIKFRAKTATTQRWAYGHYAFVQGYHVIYEDGDPFVIVRSTLYQYTGLTDKNGLEIYEGDIVEINHPFSQRYHLGEVFYDGYQFSVKGFWFPHYDLPNDAFSEGIGYTEVIGNIHENPELLEAGI